MSSQPDIKKARIKSYFLQAAKETVLREGARAVSVRRVAEAAGYSYATIYHYYRNLNDLLWDVRRVLMEELRQSLSAAPAAGVGTALQAYAAYYVAHPHVFEFFYQYPLRPPAEEDGGAAALTHDIFAQTQAACAAAGAQAAQTAAKACLYAVHGLLTLYFSSNGMSRTQFFDDLSQTVTYLLPGADTDPTNTINRDRT